MVELTDSVPFLATNRCELEQPRLQRAAEPNDALGRYNRGESWKHRGGRLAPYIGMYVGSRSVKR